MQYRYFIGIDISKATLDIALLNRSTLVRHYRIENTAVGIRTFFCQLKGEYPLTRGNTLYCMEHTGIYKEHLLRELSRLKADVWLESALRIKRSGGIQRGKSDQIDSERIARYCYTHREKVRLWTPTRRVLAELKQLSRMKSRLLRAVLMLEVPPKESQGYLRKGESRWIATYCQGSLKALRRDIAQTEASMQRLIGEDFVLAHYYELITSGPAIGPVTATELLIYTDEFKKFREARPFATYCGVAPFGQDSGTSLKVKARVSKIGSKHLKTVLHMAALSAISRKGELRDYYLRKVGEGKPKMSVLNAVRNKLLLRVFACLREDRPYRRVQPGGTPLLAK
jgi:transposase